MDVLETRIDTRSAEYQANRAAMLALVADLRAELERAHTDRSPKAQARHKEQGKLTVEERLEALLDPDAPFLEVAPLAAKDMYDGRVHGAGSLAGIGRVSGREVLVLANDARIKGGTIYPLGVKKTLRCQAIALENRLPMLNLVDSGGAFLPLQSELFPDLDDGGRVFYNQAQLSKLGVPQITCVMGLCTAGAAYMPAMSDHAIHVAGTGAIFLGGPPLVRAATGEEVTAEELGGARLHCAESGVSDYYAEDDAHALAIARDLVALLPPVERARIPTRPPAPPLYPADEIYGLVPRALSTPYDVRELLARLLDGSQFHEFKRDYGPTLVCGWGYLHGMQVGLLGNNGVLFSESSLKAAQFIQLCDRDGVPLVFLQNINGYIIGREYERGGITKDGHKMVNAVATAGVPKLTVIVGASFGAGNYGMCGRAYSPRFLWMWPNARIGVMGPDQAASVLVSVKNEQQAREGLPPMTPEEVAAIQEPIQEAARREGSAYHSTANLWDDGILDPARTRDVLALGLSAALNAPLRSAPWGYGVFRM
ncbi:MAG TPA: carboxyl transferase domain-containing protein [Myxococcota bacterium]|nr:carboxyl transferase domain-containing protein [Myxococcota bacterium]HRY97010.1 carboxyl transferase domain-containing protein [Myxococcota bacterium]